MNHSITLQQPALKPRFAAALIALGYVVAVPVRPVVGQVPADVKRAADTLVSSGVAKAPASTLPTATPASPPTALTDIGSDDAAKLQAARIRYGRLAQNFPGQFTDFEARVTEVDRLLRASLSKPCEMAPAIITATVPLTPVDNGNLVVAPQEPVTTSLPNAIRTDSPLVLRPTAKPWSVDMKVKDLKDLATRLQAKGVSVRNLSQQTEDGVSVPLHPEAEARLRALHDLLRKSDSASESTGKR